MQIRTVLAAAAVMASAGAESGGLLTRLGDGLRNLQAAVTSPFASYETAPYNVTRTEATYEERQYPALKWVCNAAVMPSDEDSNRGLFMSLFRYITGTNDQKQSMDMTTPVSMLRQPESADTVLFTMCFYINGEYQQSPPRPTEEGVFIQQMPAHRAIVVQEGGYPDEEDWQRMAQQLKEDSTSNGDSGFDYSEFYRAGYDAPWKFWSRRNEVWYVSQ